MYRVKTGSIVPSGDTPLEALYNWGQVQSLCALLEAGKALTACPDNAAGLEGKARLQCPGAALAFAIGGMCLPDAQRLDLEDIVDITKVMQERLRQPWQGLYNYRSLEDHSLTALVCLQVEQIVSRMAANKPAKYQEEIWAATSLMLQKRCFDQTLKLWQLLSDTPLPEPSIPTSLAVIVNRISGKILAVDELKELFPDLTPIVYDAWGLAVNARRLVEPEKVNTFYYSTRHFIDMFWTLLPTHTLVIEIMQ